jgi:N-dimethylarginine dimethylaminohydrolase
MPGTEESPVPHFLMTDASHYDVHYQINPWMQPEAWRANPAARRAEARKASSQLHAALLEAGATVESIDGVAGLPDLVFPANAAIVLDGRVLAARFRYPERRGEENVFGAAFEALKKRGVVKDIAQLPEGVLQEGAGDCIWDEVRGFFWVGHGQRSTHDSIAAIQQVFGQKTVALELRSDRFYHLDTCFCPLAGGKLLYYPPAFTAEALAAIHAHVQPKDRIAASDQEAAAFSVNAVNIGHQLIMAEPPQSLREKLQAQGFHVRGIDLSPFILSGGGAYCMTLRLDRCSIATAGALCAAE